MENLNQEPPAIDPDHVPETLCIGRFNVAFNGPLATITFTHARAKAGPLLDKSKMQFENVVRARVVTTFDNLAALRNLLNTILQEPGSAMTLGGGSTAH